MPGKDKEKGQGKPGPDQEIEWVAANPNPHPGEVALREQEETLQDHIDDLIDDLRDKAQAGDGEALIEALLEFCVNSDREMPRWLRECTGDVLRRYVKLHAKTLDEAFKLPMRKGFAAKKRRARHGLMIYFEVCSLHWAGAPITQELYHAVGDLHSVGRNFVEECYTRELARRGGRRVGGAMAPEALPKRLWATFERVTGKRIESRL